MSEAAVFDVVIVGAGPVGLACAAALAPSGLSLALLDRARVAVAEDPGGQDWDARVYAISPGSAEFLRAAGAWTRLDGERLAPIETMEVHGDDGGLLEFSAYELGERALAWIVEHRELASALVATVRCAPRIEVRAPVALASLSWHRDHVELALEGGEVLRTRLVVAADGLHSWTRAEAGIDAAPQPYGQRAIVANFTAAKAHRGRAFQWFQDDGSVLAWLPLPGDRVSIVWSAREARAQELLALDAPAFAQRVEDAGAQALGTLAPLTAAVSFPLAFLKLPSTIGRRLVLIGDAAHGVHPLAGQGMNLGFADASALAGVLLRRGPVEDPGSELLLRRYEQRRKPPVFAMQMVTDGLARLFALPQPAIRVLRNRGLSAVNAVPGIRRMLAQPALR